MTTVGDTISPDKLAAFAAAAASTKVPTTEIGVVSEGEGVRFLGVKGKPMQLSHLGYSHF